MRPLSLRTHLYKVSRNPAFPHFPFATFHYHRSTNKYLEDMYVVTSLTIVVEKQRTGLRQALTTLKRIRETKAGYYEPGLALLTLRYQLKREGCLFVSVFSADGFSGRERPPLPQPPRGCTEKSITQHFFPRVKHAPTRRWLCV